MSCDKFSNRCQNNCNFIDPCDVGITCEVLTTQSETLKNPENYIKAPQILAIVSIGGTIISHIDIPEGFSNITDVSRSISLTHGKLIKDQLLVEGFIINNLTYNTPAPTNSEDKCVAFRNSCNHLTVKIPFSFSMKVTGLDDYLGSLEAQTNNIYPFNCEATENLIEESNYLNNIPYCELEGCEIVDLGCNKKVSTCNMDMLDDYYNCCPPLYGRFTQKLSINLYISILVRANAQVTAITPFKDLIAP